MTLVVHPHFHRRRTGVTRHVESIVSSSLGARAFGYGLSPSVPRLGWRDLWKALRQGRTVWHAHRNGELLFGLLLRALAKDLRLVFTRHSSEPPSGYTRLLARHAEARVALTEQAQAAFALPSVVIPHGIDLNRFTPPADRQQAFDALGLSGRFGIGVVGRIRPDKGQGDFVEALTPLLSQYPQWHAALVGLAKGHDAVWAKGLCAGLEERLSLIGETEAIARWYQGLTVVVHPSHREAYSLVLLEAMASGTCVVATNLPHHPALIEHGRTGFLYPVGDVRALRALLGELLSNPALAVQMGQNACEEARARLGIAHEAKRLQALYDSL